MLRLPPKASFRYVAGQYLDLIGKAGLRRSYSIANVAGADGKLELHVRRVDNGVMSARLFDEARVGDLLRLEGPLGTFFLRDTTGLDLVFLATGTGVAPVKAMLSQLARPPPRGAAALGCSLLGRPPCRRSVLASCQRVAGALRFVPGAVASRCQTWAGFAATSRTRCSPTARLEPATRSTPAARPR